MSGDLVEMKAKQKSAWSSFRHMEMFSATAAPALIRFAGIQRGQRVLDVACGTGVVALTAARDLVRHTLGRITLPSCDLGCRCCWH